MLKNVCKTIAVAILAATPLMASESFGGIGVSIYQVNSGVKIIDVIPETPAAKSKLQAGDILISIDGESLKGKTLEESKTMLRGLDNKPVEIVYVSKGDTLSTVLRRVQITVTNLEKERVESWYGQRSEYEASELQTFAESVESEKQLVAVLNSGIVVKSNESFKFNSMNGIFVERSDNSTPKIKKNAVNTQTSVKITNVSRAIIAFNLETAGYAKVSLATTDGVALVKLQCPNAQAGYNSLKWNLENIPSGRYVVSVEQKGVFDSKNVLIK
ncbi:MAG: PDZ domain-containing protein [Fibrobacter sp.]|nr:PDZ domain-containing protein [Fibrobacter sp.]